MSVNPYDPPRAVTFNANPAVARNPARGLLYLLAAICGVLSFSTLPNGPPRIVIYQLATWSALFMYGALAVLLARRRFDTLNRLATIGWSASAICCVLFAIIVVEPPSIPPSARDVPGMIVVGLCLAALLTVAVRAIKRPVS